MLVKPLLMISVFLCTALAFLEQQITVDNKIDFSSSTDKIEAGLPLKFNCKFDPSENRDVDTLLTLTLSKRSFGDTLYRDLVTVNHNHKVIKADDFDGKLTEHMSFGSFKSELTVEYENPSDDQRGEYKCQAVGLDRSKIIIGKERSMTIGYEPVGVDQLQKCMAGGPKPSLGVLKNFLIKCGASSESWFPMWREVAQRDSVDDMSIVGVSPVFESSSFYIFTKRGINFQQGQRICSKYNGYFAEINTEKEFDFIAKSADNLRGTNTPFPFLMTGAHWQTLGSGDFKFYTHPGASMYLGHWGTGEPNNKDVNGNWLSLQTFNNDNSTVLMADTLKERYNLAYLCEVSRDEYIPPMSFVTK